MYLHQLLQIISAYRRRDELIRTMVWQHPRRCPPLIWPGVPASLPLVSLCSLNHCLRPAGVTSKRDSYQRWEPRVCVRDMPQFICVSSRTPQVRPSPPSRCWSPVGPNSPDRGQHLDLERSFESLVALLCPSFVLHVTGTFFPDFIFPAAPA